jgi:hypothetical protein
MKVDKGRILDLLSERGETDKVALAERSLPVTVDTKGDADELAALGLDEEAVRGFVDAHRDGPVG